MDRLEAVLRTHPHPASEAGDEALACIRASAECAAACTACADACLSEERVEDLVRCIRLNLDCADICEVTGRVIARPSRRDEPTLEAVLDACATICRACADECESHAEMEHCEFCAEACRVCAEACEKMVAALVP